MKIIEPIEIKPESLGSLEFQVMPDYEVFQVQPGNDDFHVLEISTNVPEDDYPIWDNATTYEEDDWVVWNRHIYKAVTQNTGKRPDENPDDWLDGGYTNRWRMFDQMLSSATTNPDIIDVSISVGKKINAIAFFNVDAGGITVRSIDPSDGIIYEREVAPVSTEGIDNWYAYFFNPIQLIRDFIVSDIQASSFGGVQIILTRTGETVSVGEIVVGTLFDVGNTLHGSEFGINDYSVKERDEFGNWRVVPRGYSKRAEFDITMETRNTGAVQRKLTEYRAKPLVWIGNSELEITVIYGYYRDFSIIVSGPYISDGTISVEGLN